MKNKNGITLIALIITIIVLLILAGVSISIIVGDNGVIKQAQTAKDKTDLANAQSAVETAVATLQTEYMAEKTTNVNKNIGELFTYSRLNSELEKMGYKIADYNSANANKTVFGENSVHGGKFTTQIQLVKAEEKALYNVVLIKKSPNSVVCDGKVELAKGTIASSASVWPGKEEIGDYYPYSVTVNGVTVSDWRVFWADEGGTYIITTDYLPVSALGSKGMSGTIANKVGLTTQGTYRAYWAESDLKDEISAVNTEFGSSGNINNTFLSNYHRYTLNGSNSNSKVVSTLLNPSNWSNLVVSGTGASFAIGGPTLEMYMKSWNEKTKNDTKKAVISCNPSGKGYQMKIDSANFTLANSDDNNYDAYLTDANMNKTTEYGLAGIDKASLYYPYNHSVDSGNCSGYWLASPSSYNSANVCRVGYDGSVNYYGYNYALRALRPIVYLQ